MAKYYLGTYIDGELVPIKLADVGTSILDVVNYTGSFVDEVTLKDHLFDEQLIQYYNSDLVYIMEEGTKDKRTYKCVPMGSNIITAGSKTIFKKSYIHRFLRQNMYNRDFYSSLMTYYIKKLGIASTIEKRIAAMVYAPSQIHEFASKTKRYLTNEAKKIFDELEDATVIRDYNKMQRLLDELSSAIIKDKDNLINSYYYFRKSLKNMYTGTVERINTAYEVIVRANMEGIESYETNPDEDHDLFLYIDEIFNSLVHQYDSKTKKYKRDKDGNKKVNERNIYELGMLIEMYQSYQNEILLNRIKSEEETDEYEVEHEEFLEESDFARLHTSSEREGYSLRKTNHDLY